MKLSLWSRKLTEILFNLVEDYNNPSREYEFVYEFISLGNLQWVIKEYVDILNKSSNLLYITKSKLNNSHFSEEIPDLKSKNLVKYLTERCLVMEKMLDIKSSVKNTYEESAKYFSTMKHELSKSKATSTVVIPFNTAGYLHQNIALNYIYRNFVQLKEDWRWESFKQTPPKKIIRDVVLKEYNNFGVDLNLPDIQGDAAWLELYKFVYVMKASAKQYSKFCNDLKEVF